MREFDWIERYFAPLAAAEGLGLKDDAALLRRPVNPQLVITTDTLNEGVHFNADTKPDQLAQKALRVNLSDLAAMGACPLGYTLNLSLPAATGEAFIAAFAEGLSRDQQQYGIMLYGGDTTRTHGSLGITITALGMAETPWRRSGAQAGDGIYVTGTIGDAYLGLRQYSPALRMRYELPEPRLALIEGLQGIVSACIDISDGLAQDADHLCHASGLGASIEAAQVPLSSDARRWLKEGGKLAQLLGGGDDYELCFTAASDCHEAIARLASRSDIAITRIGQMQEGNGLQILHHGTPMQLSAPGWQHF